eukprot:2408045-Amphidinium_carterae.1
MLICWSVRAGTPRDVLNGTSRLQVLTLVVSIRTGGQASLARRGVFRGPRCCQERMKSLHAVLKSRRLGSTNTSAFLGQILACLTDCPSKRLQRRLYSYYFRSLQQGTFMSWLAHSMPVSVYLQSPRLKNCWNAYGWVTRLVKTSANFSSTQCGQECCTSKDQNRLIGLSLMAR